MQKFVGYVTWRQIFNKFRLFNFSEIFTIMLLNINTIEIQQRKSKNYLLGQKIQKSLYYRNCIGQTNFWP